jgi:hypothetical protein
MVIFKRMVFATSNTRYHVVQDQFTNDHPTDWYKYRSSTKNFKLSYVKKLRSSHTVHSEATKQIKLY